MKKVLEIYIVIINLLYLIFSFLGIFYCIDSYYRDASYEMFAIELFWLAETLAKNGVAVECKQASLDIENALKKLKTIDGFSRFKTNIEVLENELEKLLI